MRVAAGTLLAVGDGGDSIVLLIEFGGGFRISWHVQPFNPTWRRIMLMRFAGST
jgi:hypothetical protein